MRKYLAPLIVFVLGNLALLFAFAFMPAIGAAGANLSAETAEMASTFWLWTWVVGSVRLWVFLAFELAVLFGTVMAFLKVR